MRDRVLELGEPPLLASQYEQPEPVRHGGVPALGPVPYGEGVGEQLLCLLKAPVHEREHGLAGTDVPMLGGLTQLVGQRAHRVELGVDAGTIGTDPQAVQAVVMAREHPLLVTDLLAERDQLVCHLDGFRGEIQLRTLHGDPVPFDDGGEGCRVATPPRDVQRLLREPDPPIARRIVASGRGQPDEEAYAREALALVDRGQGTLQQGHQAWVGAGADPCEPAAVSERCAREVVSEPAAFGELCRLTECLLRRRRVACARLGVSQREQQLAQRGS